MEIVAAFIVATILGLLPAYIAQSKGRDFGVFWIYGVVLFPNALIHQFDYQETCAQTKQPDMVKARRGSSRDNEVEFGWLRVDLP